MIYRHACRPSLTSYYSSNGLLDVDVLKLFLGDGMPELESSCVSVADPDPLPPAHHVAHLGILTATHRQSSLKNKSQERHKIRAKSYIIITNYG